MPSPGPMMHQVSEDVRTLGQKMKPVAAQAAADSATSAASALTACGTTIPNCVALVNAHSQAAQNVAAFATTAVNGINSYGAIAQASASDYEASDTVSKQAIMDALQYDVDDIAHHVHREQVAVTPVPQF